MHAPAAMPNASSSFLYSMYMNRINTMDNNTSNLERTTRKELARRIKQLEKEAKTRKKEKSKATRKFRRLNALKPFEAELIKLQQHLERHNKRMIVLFEGRDGAGKGGAIQRVTHYMNPRHFSVVALGRPTETQRSQWYFQKYACQFPRGGEIVFFDRSWYNRAMVEPIFKFCTEEEHENFMQGVVGFETDLVRQGMILIKFYFSVSKKEQARRFEIRKVNPLKQWKLSEIDLQAQDRWNDFTKAKYEVLKRTHTTLTPWTIVRADSKYLARLNAIKVILNSVDYDGRNDDLDYKPDSKRVLSGAEELENMKALRITEGVFSG
ncbi:MAG: polyphosphate kinase 2 [bacterium]|nr:polyphosphate kinase 2 [bacterium]